MRWDGTPHANSPSALRHLSHWLAPAAISTARKDRGSSLLIVTLAMARLAVSPFALAALAQHIIWIVRQIRRAEGRAACGVGGAQTRLLLGRPREVGGVGQP